jgi:hypothetical protein
MTSFDEGLVHLKGLIDAEVGANGARNEATTRLQLVDELLFRVLGWDKRDCHAEERFDGKYTDYSLSAPHRALIVEAKREGEYFALPAGQLIKSPRVQISYFKEFSKDAYAAIQQCADYCKDRGAQYGVVCNGHQLIAFIGSRQDGVPPLEGEAIVFDSLMNLRDNFQQAWECLAKDGVQMQGLSRQLSQVLLPVPPSKLSRHTLDYPGYKSRNPHQTELDILVDLIIEDVVRATRNEPEFLEACYCPSGALSQYAVVSKQILESRYAALDEATQGPAMAPVTTQHGIDADLLARSINQRPILLVGDVGVGKTMFVRHLITIDAKDILTGALVLYINLGEQPTLTRDIPAFVAREFTRQLREIYSVDIEERGFVRGVYHGDLLRFERGVLGELKVSNPEAFHLKEIEYLEGLIADSDQHMKRSLEHLERGRQKQVVIFLDNVDQRPDEFQQEVFLTGTSMAANWPATVFISLRPETFYRSREAGALSGYHARAFTVSPPRLDLVIKRRLEYALSLATGGKLQSLQSVQMSVPTVADYMKVMLYSFERNRELMEFCDSIAGGNIRVGLDFIKMFLGSGHVDTEKILSIYRRSGRYEVPLHEFMRAVLYGDHIHYDPASSQIINVFDITSNDAKEHFLTPLLLAEAERLGQSQPDGYLGLEALYRFAQDLGFVPMQIHAAITKCLSKRLMERPTRSATFSTERRAPEWTHIRITGIGAYYVKRLVRNFTYVDAVIVDTPIVDDAVRGAIDAAESIAARLDRAERFRRYLDTSWQRLGLGTTVFDWNRMSRGLQTDIDAVRLAATGSFRVPSA